MATPGVVYLVGAGPGDPGLITRRGAELLAQADVIVHDHLAATRLLELASPSAEILCVGKSIGHCTMSQDRIEQLLIDKARLGHRVVRLKGGDPLVFGRGAEEAASLRAAGIRHEIIPGVTAGVGVPAYAGIPVTHRAFASAVAFVTGHADPDAPGSLDWDALARFPGTLVVYMGVTHLEAIRDALIARGRPRDEPAAVIEWGSTPRQRTLVATLSTLPERAREIRLAPPALLVIGAVAGLRDELAWFEHRPLHGQRIVVTRPDSPLSTHAHEDLEALGAEVISAPMVLVRALDDLGPLDAAIDRLARYDWVVFASANGVDFLFQRILDRGLDARAFGAARIAAIGPATARALARFHLRADLVPDEFRSEGLARVLAEQARGGRILLARANRGRDLLERELRQVAEVDQVAVYQNLDAPRLPDDVIDRIMAGSIDWVTLTSSAIASRFLELLPEPARAQLRGNAYLASLSEITSETIRERGFSPHAQAAEPTWPALVQAIVDAVAHAGTNNPV